MDARCNNMDHQMKKDSPSSFLLSYKMDVSHPLFDRFFVRNYKMTGVLKNIYLMNYMIFVIYLDKTILYSARENGPNFLL